ncbi:putative E3 ubiquitin-protein ligase [Dimargaris xerosporica]|nr:putative E3 ubiquitin-protein ligase [Dimargaris xerosporica]
MSSTLRTMNHLIFQIPNIPRWKRYSTPTEILPETLDMESALEAKDAHTDDNAPEMSLGRCMCCDSKLRYPKDSACFRCLVCDTVNDLTEFDHQALSESRRRRPMTLDRFRGAFHAWQREKITLLQLERLIAEAFTHWDRLNYSFANGKHTSTSQSGVAVADVREMYRLLLDLPAPCIRAMMSGTEALLKRPYRRFHRKDDIRFLLILLENPLLYQHNFPQETHYHHQIIKRILGLMSCLPNTLHHYVVHWFSQLSPAQLHKRVELVNHFVTYRLTTYARSRNGKRPKPYESDWCFKAAARTMALLAVANSMAKTRLPISEFYNTGVDCIDLTADYDAWQQRTGHFSFCQYPMLISMGAKMRILQLDAHRQMESKVKEALLTTILKKRLTDPYLALNICRDCIVEDSLHQLSSHEADLKKKLKIQFVGEEGVDAGGLTKEWFMLLLKDLFNPLNGMFTLDEESRLFWFNPASFETSNQYFLVGVIFGLAIYNSTILDVHFPLACYKKLLDRKVGLRDLKELRPSLARGLRELLRYPGDDVEDVFCLHFTVDYLAYGERRTVPLIPNGDRIPVTRSNRAQYVSRYIDYVLNESVARQFDPFRRGFYFVCGGNALSLFHPQEIELLVQGSPEPLQLNQLAAATRYHGFAPDDPLIVSFWELVAGWDLPMQQRFLVFVTGSDRIPALGTETLALKIVCLGDDVNRFPIAHTCFNQLGLYRYDSKEALAHKLLRAIQESEGFWLK